MSKQPQFPNEQSIAGEFKRQDDAFRRWVSADGGSGYPAAAGRYHLYVSWACPWAHRTIIVRTLKRLEAVIGMTVVDPIRDERGWAFREGPGHSQDPLNGFHFLSEAYRATDAGYRGRVTVPVSGTPSRNASSRTPTMISCACSTTSSITSPTAVSIYIRNGYAVRSMS